MSSISTPISRGASSVVSEGDVEFTAFFRTEYPALVRTLYVVLHDRERAQDVAQDAFVQLFARWRRISHYERPDAWVRRVAIRMAVRGIRRERLRPRLERELDPAPLPKPIDIDVVRAIRQLPTSQRAAVALFYLEDEAGRVVLGVTFGATGLAVDAQGNVYVGGGDGNLTNHQVIRVDPSGHVTTVAGTGEVGHSGDGGPATKATLGVVWDLALDASGDLYMSVGNQVREVDTSGVITTLAGTGAKGFSGDGGPAEAAQLDHPSGVAVDTKGNVYILDIGNDRIRRIDTRGIITTIAGPGRGKDCFSGDGGPAIEAGFCAPEHLWIDAEGDLFVADTYSRRIREIDTNGIVTTVAGDGSPSFSGDGGQATHAGLSKASGVAVGPDGALYIADSGHDRVRRVVL